jgi:hypothetical protein
MYQRPEDGCQGQALNSAPTKTSGSASVTKSSFSTCPRTPRAPSSTSTTLTCLAGPDSYVAHLSNGEQVTVYFGGGLGSLAVLPKTTLVELIGGGYGNETASRRVLPWLRPVGK